MGETIRFAAEGGECEGWLAKPASPNGKGIVVIQEWWGLNDHIKDVTERFAAAGYLALAPDLYHGVVTRSPDEAGKLLMALDIARAERDLRGSVQKLKADTGRRVGIVGFCMGGALSLFAACRNGADIGACVVYYGGHPKVEFDWDGLKAPVLGHWAEHDDFANANVPRFSKELLGRGRAFDFHTYPGTKHAFFNDTRPEVHDAAAAKLSWERTLAFYAENL
ncbi:MAG: dienelactone hydrolase family protein [Vicinamibacteria bacterium]|nr:dienelactone hydrolase family protein [Vicinamibacteria bacterium]